MIHRLLLSDKQVRYKDWTETQWKRSQCPKKKSKKTFRNLGTWDHLKMTKSGNLEAKPKERCVLNHLHSTIWNRIPRLQYWCDTINTDQYHPRIYTCMSKNKVLCHCKEYLQQLVFTCHLKSGILLILILFPFPFSLSLAGPKPGDERKGACYYI